MPIQFPQPYRGQPRPKYPKPRRQFRNPKQEKLEDTSIVISSFVLLCLAGIFLAFQTSSKLGIGFTVGLFVTLFIIGFFISAAIADGLQNINKFRDDYDFDSSLLEEYDTDKKTGS